MNTLIPTLTLQVTYQCNAECDHCGPRCGPRETDRMTLAEMRNLIGQASELGALNVVFTGGEPSLLGCDLVDAITFVVKETPIKSTRVVTNGSWAISEIAADRTLGRWREAGLTELNVSCGEFHQRFVPMENVVRAYRAGVRAGFSTVLLGIETTRYDKLEEVREIYSRAVGGDLVTLDMMSPFLDDHHGCSMGAVLWYGRARERIDRRSLDGKPDAALGGRCAEVLCGITAQPDGKVAACCGVFAREESLLHIGEWRSEQLCLIVDRAQEDLVLNWLRYLGPLDMKMWLCEKHPGLRLRETHMTACDLCGELLLNPEVERALLTTGIERSGDVVASRVAVDAIEGRVEAFRYSADGG